MVVPKVFRNKLVLASAGLIAILLLIVGVLQAKTVNKAHSSFENYYVFRGCVQLLQRGPDYGICKTGSGKVIKIVEFRNKWYLDGDLPLCWHNACL